MTPAQPTAHRFPIFPFPPALAQSVLIVLVAALLCLPCLLVGIPPGYDADYHTAYQYHFSRQFWSGDLYPRWLTGANRGYGSPAFLIQYPLPYFVTALLRPVTSFTPDATREARELGVLCFLVLAAAGLAARAWFRHRCHPWAATIAALVYISLPYILGQALYLRTGLGELCALVWIPVALALCDTIQPRFVSVSALAVAFALLLFTHLTSAVLFLPFLFGYALVSSPSASLTLAKRLGSLLLALTLGIGIAAVYVLPLVAYRHLFDLHAMQALMPSFELGRWFSYVTSSSMARRFVVPAMIGTTAVAFGVALYIWRAGGSRVSRVGMITTLALGLAVLIPDLGPWLIRASAWRVSSFDTAGDFSARMLFTGILTTALGFLAYGSSSKVVTRREHVLLAVVCGAFVLMLPWSAPLWKASEGLASIQFPFRFGGIHTVAVAGLFAVAMDACLQHRRRWKDRRSLVVLSLAALAVIGAGSFTWRVPERFRSPSTADLAMARNVDNIFRMYVSPAHVPRLAKKLGAAPDSFEVALTPVEDVVRAECLGDGVANVVRVGPRVLRVSTQCGAEARVQVGQLYSPLWRSISPTRSSDHLSLGTSAEGLMEVTVRPGQHDFELVFDGGWPERVGIIVTLVSLVTAVGGPAFVGLWGMRTSNVHSGRLARTL